MKFLLIDIFKKIIFVNIKCCLHLTYRNMVACYMFFEVGVHGINVILLLNA